MLQTIKLCCLALPLMFLGGAYLSVEPSAQPPTGALAVGIDDGGFPEGDGAIRALLLQFDRDCAGEMFPVYRDLAKGLDPRTSVLLAVARDEDADAGRFALESAGFDRSRIAVAVNGDDISIWARDRMVVVGRGQGRRMLVPASDLVAHDRRGDLQVANGVRAVLENGSRVEERLAFEGGNVLFSSSRAFVGANLIADNLDVGDDDDVDQATARLRARLRTLFGREVLVVGDPEAPAEAAVPHEHLDMYLTVLGNGRVLLGDPRLGAEYLRKLGELGLDEALTPAFGVWTVQNQHRFFPIYDGILAQLEQAGLHVDRVPIVHGESDMVLTWNNALVERRGGRLQAYVPSYGVPLMDDMALESYRRMGCRAVPIQVDRIAPLGGTVRCVTNVLDWDPGDRK